MSNESILNIPDHIDTSHQPVIIGIARCLQKHTAALSGLSLQPQADWDKINKLRRAILADLNHLEALRDEFPPYPEQKKVLK